MFGPFPLVLHTQSKTDIDGILFLKNPNVDCSVSRSVQEPFGFGLLRHNNAVHLSALHLLVRAHHITFPEYTPLLALLLDSAGRRRVTHIILVTPRLITTPNTWGPFIYHHHYTQLAALSCALLLFLSISHNLTHLVSAKSGVGYMPISYTVGRARLGVQPE